MTIPVALPPVEALRKCFYYNPETGVFLWRKRDRETFKSHKAFATWNGRYAGEPAGTVTAAGRLRVLLTLEGRQRGYLAHRVMFAMSWGTDPGALEVDHENHNPLDNRLDNLRLATTSQNQRNRRGAQRNSGTGIRGVWYYEKCNRWRAHIKVDKRIQLGQYRTSAEAASAAASARLQYFGEFAGRP